MHLNNLTTHGFLLGLPESAAVKKNIHILLLIATQGGYGREVLRGIRQYALEHEPCWNINVRSDSCFIAGCYPYALTARGIISQNGAPEFWKFASRRGVCTVVISGEDNPATQSVRPDNCAVGRLGAQHLMQLKLPNLGYCGIKNWRFSEDRLKGFRDKAMAGGIVPAVRMIDYSKPGDRLPENILIARWLAKLPKPIGIMACHDALASEVVWACGELKLRIPEEVAVLGVDNDAADFLPFQTSLSSIILPTQAIGYTAAKQLDLMLRSKAKPSCPIVLPPSGIIQRASTDICLVDDAAVSQAMFFIREHISKPIGVPEILANVRVSRRMLYYKFMKFVGRTPHDQIVHVRIEKAKPLLTETCLKIGDIAARTGFPNYAAFSVAFRRLEGLTPGEYRSRSHPPAKVDRY